MVPLQVPTEVWALVAGYTEPNLWTYTQLSQVCVGARTAFTRDALWRQLDPYEWKHGIYEKFMNMWTSFSNLDKSRIKMAWTESAETLIYLVNKGKLPLLFSEHLHKKGIKCGSNRWFELGYILATVKFTQDVSLRIQKSDQTALLMAAVKINPLAANRAELSKDWDLAYEAVKGCGDYLEKIVASQTRDYYKFCIAAVGNAGGRVLQYIPEEFLAEKPIALALASLSPETVSWTRDLFALPDYKQIVLRCLTTAPEGWTAYISLPHYLQTDPDIVLAVFMNLPRTLPQFGVMATTLYDHELVKKAISIHGSAITFAPPFLQANKQIVSQALDTYALAIGSASLDLRADRELAIKALNKDGRAFPLVSPDLQEDQELMRLAVESDGSAIDYIPHAADDFELALTAMESSPRSLHLLSARLRDNDLIVSRAVRKDGFTLEHASQRLRGDKATVHLAIKQEPLALRYASAQLQDDLDTVMIAIQYNVCALECASRRVAEMKPVMLAAIRLDPWARAYIPSQLFDREIVLCVLEAEKIEKSQLLPFVEDREVVLAAVRQSGSLLAICPKFSDDEEVVTAAITNDGSALIYASTRLQRNSDFELLAAIGYKGMHRGDYLQRFIP